jgi:outer membrane protein TolC
MDRAALVSWYRRMHRRLFASGLCAAGISLAGAGCSHLNQAGTAHATPAAAATPAASETPGADNRDGRIVPAGATDSANPAGQGDTGGTVVQASAKQVSELPAISPDRGGSTTGVSQLPAPRPMTDPAVPLSTPAADAPTLPIGLDTVFHLAQDQNAQVGIARAKVRQAYAEKDVASLKWLPDVYVGTAWYRHEGGIQNEDGTLTHSSTGAMFAGGELDGRFDVQAIAYEQINAQRKVWQQRGELSRVTSETLLDASDTYIDWLTARSGEAVALKIQDMLKELLSRARDFAKAEPGRQVEVHRIEAELASDEQTLSRLRQQAAAAEAKLLYVLGLNPCSHLEPIDTKLLPFDLLDAAPPTCDLIAQALRTGPGVREMEGLLALIQQGIERSKGPAKYLPVFEARVAEGAFGAGPGDEMTWDNRLDLCLQARWNLTGFASACDRRRAAQAQVDQANLAYQDLRGKLAAGVSASRAEILSGRDQIAQTERQIRDAGQAYELSRERYRQNVQGSSASEVLLSVNAFMRAQTTYLTVTNAYDKAQLRLYVLLGPGAAACGPAVEPVQLPNAPRAAQ